MIQLLAPGLLVVSIAISVFLGRQPPPRVPTRLPAHPERDRVPLSERFGRSIRGVLRQPADPTRDRDLGRNVIVVTGVGLFSPVFAIVFFLVLHATGVLSRRRQVLQRTERISHELADVIDLFAVALVTGNNVADATRQVSRWVDGEFGEAFEWCSLQVTQGRTLSDALELLPSRIGPQVRPLISALVATERYGAPIAHNLTQLAKDSRADRRRRAEATARRLPVTLLFPLVSCVLPAFLLLTIAPVVAETFSVFGLVASP